MCKNSCNLSEKLLGTSWTMKISLVFEKISNFVCKNNNIKILFNELGECVQNSFNFVEPTRRVAQINNQKKWFNGFREFPCVDGNRFLLLNAITIMTSCFIYLKKSTSFFIDLCWTNAKLPTKYFSNYLRISRINFISKFWATEFKPNDHNLAK